LKTCLAFGLRNDSDEGVRRLLSIATTGKTMDRDSAPLMLHPSFTWNTGYGGDARKSFEDFKRFASVSEALSTAVETDEEAISVACGTDLLLGLARTLWESYPPEGLIGKPFRAHYVYSGWASGYCFRIQWAARLLERSEEMSAAIGAPSLAEFRQHARDVYPDLRRQIDAGVGYATCDSWEDALSS
jgi:hypothetical protein